MPHAPALRHPGALSCPRAHGAAALKGTTAVESSDMGGDGDGAPALDPLGRGEGPREPC